MPGSNPTTVVAPGRHPLAARRILRLALGSTLCLLFSQVIGWPASFIAAALTLMILGLPLPPPGLKKGLVIVLALLAPLVLGSGLLPFLNHARWAGIGLTAVALFYTFYFTARGGSPVLGTFMTMGLTLVVTIGSVSAQVLQMLISSLAISAAVGLFFVWFAHFLLPDPVVPKGPTKPPSPEPDLADAPRKAMRSLLVVLPLALAFLFMSGSPAYTVVMIKVAALGQQATSDKSQAMGRELLESTFWGGLAAMGAWYLLKIWPSLTMYCLLFAAAGLIFGRWIFKGPALHPKFSMASYAYLTMLIILAPSLTDSPLSSSAGSAFYSRLFLIVLVGIYGTLAVRVFDAFLPARPATQTRPVTG